MCHCLEKVPYLYRDPTSKLRSLLLLEGLCFKCRPFSRISNFLPASGTAGFLLNPSFWSGVLLLCLKLQTRILPFLCPQRFKENGAKDETHVGFSETLQAAHYLTPASRASRPRYKLEGVIVHEGDSPDAGHYTAHLFVGGGWYHFDDAIVTRVEWTEVAAAQGYIFFYRRSDPDSSLLVKPAHGRARDARGGRARTAPQDGARAHSLARTQTARACMESEASTARADAFEAQAPAEKERGGAVSTTVSTEHLLGDETPGKSAPVAKVGGLSIA